MSFECIDLVAQPPRDINLARYVIGAAAARTPEKIALEVYTDAALHHATEHWTFRQLDNAILNIASGLRARGMSRGDRILIRLDNTSAFALLFFGATAAGIVPIPASTQLSEVEAEFVRRDSGAKIVALSDSLFNKTDLQSGEILTAEDITRMLVTATPTKADYADTAANEPAYMIYTSGTTSRPKGVLHAHRAAWGRQPMYAGWSGLTGQDRVLHAGAFNWTYTLGVGLTDPWSVGAASIVYTGEKRPEIWPQLICDSKATLFAAVPSLFRQILKYASPTRDALGALRHGLMAGEAPSAGLFDDWHTATGLHLYEAFGMSEISTFISSGPNIPRRAGYIGPPQSGRRIAILPIEGGVDALGPGEEGLLAVHRSDPSLMLGYWQRPSEEAEVFRGDWFVGGDLAIMDADGYIAHRGRNNDVMKALGYRVAPQEVEAVLASCPGVAEVACREVVVREGVSVIGAFIVPSPASTITTALVTAHAAAQLAAYKCPRAVYIVDHLPRTSNGKLQRKALDPTHGSVAP
ncbi:MAG: acyl--CoA ligase [Hyphomicrobiaceae bacterium]|nr:acyl--CoA ligase [Hyphomicrobiaceae bacterium]